MKNSIVVPAFFLFIAVSVSAQIGPTGVWETVDDESGDAVSHVKISLENGLYSGKVIKLLPAADKTICENCKGSKKDAPIEGMEILWNLKSYKDYWSSGTILDPANGKEYKCSVWMDSQDVLVVRGYLGFSILGRSQKWFRVQE